MSGPVNMSVLASIRHILPRLRKRYAVLMACCLLFGPVLLYSQDMTDGGSITSPMPEAEEEEVMPITSQPSDLGLASAFGSEPSEPDRPDRDERTIRFLLEDVPHLPPW